VLVFASPVPDAEPMCRRLESIVAAPIDIGTRMVTVNASIGTSLGVPSIDDLVRLADQQMLAQKALRRNG
jgi:GGDEF domain-containing protein